ncbi:chaperonin 10-like protein [Thelonectria olida]|uniref:Chaperonin 10-like protein n=1 Tax=Thelonectria olida TaxID=1576542 RepID=A0A9P8VT08_9HYPO|nr:chaperonin 10-like protein [Thelonectria olida]
MYHFHILTIQAFKTKNFKMSKESSVNRAVVYSNPPSLETEVVSLPIPTPAVGEVLVRLMYSGVCHTDYGICTNGFDTLPVPTPKGQVGGHEGVGKVISHGPGVDQPPIGSLVGIKWSASACLTCDICLEGGETSCPSGTVSGYLTPGTFQQYCAAPANYVTPIPEGVDLAGAAPLMCGGVTVYTALKRSGVKQSQWVVVSGAGGGLGHLAIQYAKACGTKVIALDSGAKKDLCYELGADHFIDFTQHTSEDLTAEIHRISGNLVKLVLVCSASKQAYDQAVSFLGFRGVMACIGVPEGPPGPIQGAEVGDFIQKELTMFANKSGNRLEARECLEIASRGLVRTHYQLKTMDQLTEIFHDFEDGKINGRIVLDLR